MKILFYGHIWDTNKTVGEAMKDVKNKELIHEVADMIDYRESLGNSLKYEIIQVGTYGFIKYDSTPNAISIDKIIANRC